jgi:phosphoserine phosphatase
VTEALRNGANIAAWFDLDGTLLPEPSLEQRFFNALRRSGAIPFVNYLLWAVESLRLLPSGRLAFRYANKRYLAGLNTDLAFELFDSLTFFEGAIARVAWHARHFHQIVLLSGTLQPLAQLAAAALQCELQARGLAISPHVVATRLAEAHGHWTGRRASEAIYGAAKANEVVSLAQKQQWDLRQCHAYGNSPLDRDFLRAVGHGHAVNPGRKLAAIAQDQDWPIWRWHQQSHLASRGTPDGFSEIHSFEDPA